MKIGAKKNRLWCGSNYGKNKNLSIGKNRQRNLKKKNSRGGGFVG